jgi:hypothetical protein
MPFDFSLLDSPLKSSSKNFLLEISFESHLKSHLELFQTSAKIPLPKFPKSQMIKRENPFSFLPQTSPAGLLSSFFSARSNS